jgi:hypothetical protein
MRHYYIFKRRARCESMILEEKISHARSSHLVCHFHVIFLQHLQIARRQISPLPPLQKRRQEFIHLPRVEIFMSFVSIHDGVYTFLFPNQLRQPSPLSFLISFSPPPLVILLSSPTADL